MRGLYNAEVQYFDEQLGDLLAELKERKMFDPTMIILTSDHGEEMGELYPDGTRIYGHGSSLTDAVLNVPLLIKLPGSSRVGSAETVARSIDLMPTVLSVADPDGVHDGRNLLAPGPDPLRGEPVLSELVTDQYGPYRMFSVQNLKFRMVRTYLFKQQRFNPPRLKFYELPASDHLEHEAIPPTEIQEGLKAALVRYRKRLHLIPPGTAEYSKAEEETLLEQLRALGYVEAATKDHHSGDR
jgi:arylsulfatase A-like enzyme